MSQRSKLLPIIIPIFIITAGVIIAMVLISSRKVPIRTSSIDRGVLAETFVAEGENSEVIIKGTGNVEPGQEVSIIPQVSGHVRFIAPDLKVGGFFKKDAVLFKIDDIDYRLALERALSARAKAEHELATIESQARVARAEWEQINNGSDASPNPLVLFEPQLKSAKAGLVSASAQVEQAQLDLERTAVTAPFSARVRSENIDLGQYVKAGSSVAVLAGTDTAEIAVPLPLDDLQWLDIPGPGERRKGSAAIARMNMGGRMHEWHGHVVRATGEVDPRTRMMQLIVEIKDPYGLTGNKDASSYTALAAGAFADVHMKGKVLKDVFIIPRTSFRDNATVWIMDSDKRLRIRRVVPLRVEKEQVIIREGLANGDLVITTNISGAADGMKLREMIKNQN